MADLDNKTIPEIVKILKLKDWMLISAFIFAVFSSGVYFSSALPISDSDTVEFDDVSSVGYYWSYRTLWRANLDECSELAEDSLSAGGYIEIKQKGRSFRAHKRAEGEKVFAGLVCGGGEQTPIFLMGFNISNQQELAEREGKILAELTLSKSKANDFEIRPPSTDYFFTNFRPITAGNGTSAENCYKNIEKLFKDTGLSGGEVRKSYGWAFSGAVTAVVKCIISEEEIIALSWHVSGPIRIETKNVSDNISRVIIK